MDKRGDISKDKLASGLLRGAVVSGLVSGLAAASLGGVRTASATCIGISGININIGDGGGCISTFGQLRAGARSRHDGDIRWVLDRRHCAPAPT